ncbi:hypothetical protein [Anaerocolumna sp. MB42-C2]|uniref:hypothetical protein n=1 Tax=Anaerocolumna sp. MB42-C2 TaxID=3070997 RepID=UPI0027E10017|nr:hypothetical protein [Anaerocolumna sp. MB42-C2]WMJ85482.1 hypothetical protein RBU59_15535 [Anaerocolumna sp. MB42-C2]
MKIYLHQPVDIQNDRFPHWWSKTYNSLAIPHKGDYIEDPIWKEPGEFVVEDVTINYYDDSCYVQIAKYNYVIPQSRKDEMSHIAELHGWEASFRKKI